MRHLGFLKNLLVELDQGVHRHNQRAARHGLQPVDDDEKRFGHLGNQAAERLIAYPSYETLTGELTKTPGDAARGAPRRAASRHPGTPASRCATRLPRLPGAPGQARPVQARKRDALHHLDARTPKVDVDGTAVRVRDRGLGTLRARLTRPLPRKGPRFGRSSSCAARRALPGCVRRNSRCT